MKENLIIMTASSRLDDLVKVAKSININYDKYNQKFNIYWLICEDQYNGHGSLDKFYEYISTTNIIWQIYDSGKPNQKNYGGDIFNESLQNFVNYFNINNPWVYILDDDDILHPNLYKIFDICLENNFYGNKEIITTINKWHCGHNREISKDIFLLQTEDTQILEWFLFDPSAVILKYNIIEKYDFISGEFLYDFNWLNMKVLRNEIDNIIWYTDYEHSWGRHVVGTYHNGLVKEENIKEFENIDINDINMDILLGNLDIELPQSIPVLKNETKKKILELIKQDINED